MSERRPVDESASAAGQRPLTEDEKDTVTTAGPPATAAAGALAGAAAGISTLVFGPIGLVVGAIAGGAAGAAVGAAGSQAAAGDYYTAEYDDYYRGLWESSPGRPADRTFDSARAGYQFGHVAAQYPEFAGRDFHEVEPELRSRWSNDLRAHGGEWETVRPDVETAYSHARSRGLGVRRDSTVIGSAGSAVDPVELARSREA